MHGWRTVALADCFLRFCNSLDRALSLIAKLILNGVTDHLGSLARVRRVL